MAKLGIEEIGAIETAVARMVANLAAGGSALRYTAGDRRLLGAVLGTEPSGFTDVELHVPAIRACYHPGTGGITLSGTTWHTAHDPDDATLAAFAQWVTAALAHEACHLLQHRVSPQMFGPNSEADAASALSRMARCTGQPADYVAYVSCQLEMEAHATQIAAELRSLGELTHDEFVPAAKASGLMAHVKRKATSSAGEEWADWDCLEARLVDEAWSASERMRGR